MPVPGVSLQIEFAVAGVGTPGTLKWLLLLVYKDVPVKGRLSTKDLAASVAGVAIAVHSFLVVAKVGLAGK